ncbi:hypothetical protein LguiA_000735 [Lonicera macranthoides]
MASFSSFYLLFILSKFISLSAQIQNISSFSSSNSPWFPTQTRILLSPSSTFAAGFRPLPASPNLYTFSIWYHNISINDTVWSANPNSPVNQLAALIITTSGQLLLNTSSGQNLWPSSTPIRQSNSTHLTLSDYGNLIYGQWESFNYPTNTILPNQNINGITISSNNGNYKFVNASELVFNATATYYSNGNNFLMLDDTGKIAQREGASILSADFGFPRIRRLTLDDDGNLKIYSFNRNSTESTQWKVVWQAVYELCGIYGTCGPNSICINYNGNSNSTYCVCPPGFRRVPGADSFTCVLKTRIVDPGNTKFLRLDYVNFSGGSNQTNTYARNYTICESSCLSKPNCLGFGFKYDGNQYCVLQLDQLLYGYWSPGTETSMFLRVDKSEPDKSNFTGMTNVLKTACPVRVTLPLPPKESNSTTRNIAIICTLFAAELISGVFFFWAFLKKYVKYRDMARTFGLEFSPTGGPKRFSYAELKIATNDFSNMIGRGGFGDVYKGELTDHRVVAVKCLKDVTGGDAEFWAEVTIIARMHHLNLVRLWGFCAEKGQRILVYEYVSNGSLDKFLFHTDREGSEEQETGSRMESEDWYFPRWAFDKVFKEMNVEDILDSRIKHCYDSRVHFDMVNRMVKTAMWCLQDRPEMRPSMGKVAKMLEGTVEIIEPTKPTIFFLGDD